MIETHNTQRKIFFFNFCTFLVNFIFDFKHIVLSRVDKLTDLPYITRKERMYTFQPDWNPSIIPYVSLYIVKKVDEGPDR